MGKKKKKKKNFNLRDYIVRHKGKIIGLVLGIIDIILIIYVARGNVANYAVVNGEEVFIGKTRNLLLGRNYITLVVSLFIYLYGLLLNKFLIKKKISVRGMVLIFGLILIFNMIMFYLFTRKVY